MAFQNAWHEEEWRVQKKWAKMHGHPWDFKPEDNPIAYNVRHEYAHILDGAYRDDHDSRITESPEFNALGPMREAMLEKRHAISHYAYKNARKLWAVAFSTYTSPIYDGRMWEDMESFVEKILD